MKMPSGPQRRGHVEEQIDEAIARGEFENLKGKGKPLKLWGDLTDRRVMREKLARDVGEGAPWEAVAAEIEFLTRRVEAELKRALEFRRARWLRRVPTTPKSKAIFARNSRPSKSPSKPSTRRFSGTTC